LPRSTSLIDCWSTGMVPPFGGDDERPLSREATGKSVLEPRDQPVGQQRVPAIAAVRRRGVAQLWTDLAGEAEGLQGIGVERDVRTIGKNGAVVGFGRVAVVGVL
jgi:hypothetical protein